MDLADVLKIWQLVTFYLDHVSGHMKHDSPLCLSTVDSQNFNLPAFQEWPAAIAILEYSLTNIIFNEVEQYVPSQ